MNKNRLKAIVLGLTLCCVSTLYAQQDLMLSQQLFSRINVNPAGTGNNEKFDVFALGRFQWAGVDHGPKTCLLNFSGYSEQYKSSLGLTVHFDNLGVAHSTTNAQIVYSYHLDITEKYILSMGLSGGANFGYFNPENNILRDEAERNNGITYVKEKTTEVSPDLNFGLEFTSMHWMVGASCTHLINDTSTTFRSGRHYYFYGRGFIPLTEHFDIAPALVYMHKHKTNVLEINAMAFYNRFIWGGVTWRPDLSNPADMSMMAITLGLEWNMFRLGYTFDLNMGRYDNLPSNTHEIMFSCFF
ncbi:MAG: type IX secretion system membrane protein PorP/SprF [Paludibacteraceae bacterium]|nr:type IX secretion system membrane protein PorP/SprF [Paludibacteraceae bacterium]MBR5373923.1 type IX secretion system membrane protein PorP/SprF [Paludibacteraceae bacterium]